MDAIFLDLVVSVCFQTDNKRCKKKDDTVIQKDWKRHTYIADFFRASWPFQLNTSWCVLLLQAETKFQNCYNVFRGIKVFA